MQINWVWLGVNIANILLDQRFQDYLPLLGFLLLFLLQRHKFLRGYHH